MTPDRRAAATRAAAVLETIAATAGRGRPPLKIRRGRSWRASTVRRRDGSLLIELTTHRAERSSDEGLLGVLAHEYAHFEYDDPPAANPSPVSLRVRG